MHIEELLVYDKEGLIPGPGETEDQFRERIHEIMNRQSNADQIIPAHHWHWPSERTQQLFGFSTRWCIACEAAHKMLPWHAAMTWIDVKRIYTIQLNPSRWIKWLVKREELLAHESVHAARSAFPASMMEEIFAYLTSPNRWRRVLGPLLQRPWEVFFLLTLLIVGMGLEIAEGFLNVLPLGSVCYWVAGVFCVGLGFRLMFLRLRILKASRYLSKRVKDSSQTLPVLFRLTDDEIREIAKGRFPENQTELRWQLIRAIYLL